MINNIYRYKKKKYSLNQRLIIQKELTQDAVDLIKELHISRLKILETMQCIVSNTGDTESVTKLKECASQLTEIDFKLQDTWGFDRNAAWHLWYGVPGCHCPILDNQDMRPHQSVINMSCQIHGE